LHRKLENSHFTAKTTVVFRISYRQRQQIQASLRPKAYRKRYHYSIYYPPDLFYRS